MLIIEHNIDVILEADYIIDLGPEAGEYGGELIFQGTIQDLIKVNNITSNYVFGLSHVKKNKISAQHKPINNPVDIAIRNFEPNVIAYSHSAGNQSYREGLAHYYQNVGINVDHTQILVTTGGSEAISIAINTIMDKGDEIIIPEPFYANYNGFSTAADITVKPITSSIDNGFALPSISEFEKLITPNTKAILICNPGNPTGYLYSKEELERLKKIVIKHNLFLFADEVYREFIYDKTMWFGYFFLNFLNSFTWQDSSKEQPALISGRITFLWGLNILATSAINLTPQKTMTSASFFWAFFDRSRESPIKSAISCISSSW